ncbi:hypothetical protein ZOSMA_89G00430 [Zostera marina]|uniref:DUF1664 domain-containing protein n=1 Tax=Zostera marina TaxID=29655 RepID=A0A0K9NK03_ZOSMR|nr:hypothetical protein ZOSMA_89G00430 [Zostera marina]
MAIPIAKLTVIVGATLAGSYLVNEGRLSDVSNIFFGAFKIFRKHIQEDKNGSSSSKKPGSDFHMAQVNNLRKQLQSLQMSGRVTVITESGQGYKTYSIMTVVIIGAMGYGYIWWKGWKISDMMFVTQSAFKDARNNIANQMDTFSSSISNTKHHLSNQIERVECTLNDCLDDSAATKEEVSKICEELSGFHVKVESVHHAARAVESKIFQMKGSEDLTTRGVYHLCQFVKKLDNKKPEYTKVLQSNTSMQALEQPQTSSSPSSSIASATDLGSPSSIVETPRVLQSSRTASISSFKDVQGLHTITRNANMRRNSMETDGSSISNITLPVNEEDSSSRSSSLFGWRLPSFNKIIARSQSSSDST